MTAPVKACSTCGASADCGGTTEKCANCWEVERRLGDYLKSDKGRRFVLDAVAKNNGRDVSVGFSIEDADVLRYDDNHVSVMLSGSARIVTGSAVDDHKRVQVASRLTLGWARVIRDRLDAHLAPGGSDVPIPMLLNCPACGARHVDVGRFATEPHRVHVCQGCGQHFQPALVPTIGVQFLPGCRDEVAEPLTREQARHARNRLPVGRKWRHRVTGQRIDTKVGDSALNSDYIEITSTCSFAGGGYVCTTCDDVALAHLDAPMPTDRGCTKFDGGSPTASLCRFCRLPKGWH